jgi:hypothetical protein
MDRVVFSILQGVSTRETGSPSAAQALHILVCTQNNKETDRSDADHSRFVIRDRSWHPKVLTPDYKTSILRSLRQALGSIPQSLSETSGPDFSHLKMSQHDNDLLLNFNRCGLPIGERIIVAGRVCDQYVKPIPQTLMEMWQANSGGRYRHKKDSYLAPVDPYFGDVGRRTSKPSPTFAKTTARPFEACVVSSSCCASNRGFLATIWSLSMVANSRRLTTGTATSPAPN